MTKKVCILGATGSIGSSALEVMAVNGYELVAASAYSNVEKMLEICAKFSPKTVVMIDEDAAFELKSKINNSDINVLSGKENLELIAKADDTEIVIAAIVGAAGLNSTLAAVRANKTILLANKETLVMAGNLFIDELKKSKAQLLPVDSEHNAIFQCLPDSYQVGQQLTSVTKIILTGSGGPFLNTPISELANKTVAQAIKHPNWSMGAKISVDSATMMNKGLEWIEAKYLFGIDDDKLEIIIHPESIIHSMVEYRDGSVLAQLGPSDMKVPIAFCLAYPKRINSNVLPLDLTKVKNLNFLSPDKTQFPALRITEQAWLRGGSAMAILNAANEVAVASFLQEEIKFTQITQIIEQTLANCSIQAVLDLSTVIAADHQARKYATELIKQWK